VAYLPDAYLATSNLEASATDDWCWGAWHLTRSSLTWF